ncbi:hypothetical protein J7M28_06495 [bacterium]|nr:hypothetical protein [bacterium]
MSAIDDLSIQRRGGGRSRRRLLLLALIFLLLSVVFTRDVILFFADSTPCGAGDSVMFAWNFWWVAEQLSDGHLFFKCDYAMLPFGIRTVYHTLIPLHCVILAPVTWLFGPLVSSNLHLILSFAIGALGMALLVRFLTGSLLAGLCGGIAFAFSTIHWYHAAGHYNFTATELLPFCLLFLLRWLKKHRTADLTAASALLALNLYNDYTTTIILGLCAFPIFVLGVVRMSKSESWKRLLRAILPAAILFGIIAFPVGYHAHEFSSLFDANWGRNTGLAVETSPDALSYVLPDKEAWFSWPLLRSEPFRALTAGGLDRPQFFGIFALILLCIGIGYLPKRDRALLICLLAALLTCFAISLGPEPRLFGVQFIPSVLSPFNALTAAPFLGDLRIPGRFGLGVALIGAIFVGIGSAWILSKVKGKETTAILLVLTAGLLFAEKVHKPLFAGKFSTPPVYEALTTLTPKPIGIVITPFHVWSGQGLTGTFPFVDRTIMLFYQTVHKTPMMNGHASRIPSEITSYYEQAPLTSSLIALQTGQGIDLEQILAEKDYVEQITYLFGVSHIVCDYRAKYFDSGLPMRHYVEEVLSGEMVYADDTGRIYELPFPDAPPTELTITPDSASARLYLMEGWHKPFIYEGQKRLVYDAENSISPSSRSNRLRVIFRSSEATSELQYSYQFSPAFPDEFRQTRFRIDLDGETIGEVETTIDEDFSIRGAVESEIEPGLHYLTLTPCSDGLSKTPTNRFGLSARAMFIEKIELKW